jgi:polyisoprenoid-binding protein YceI
MGATTATQTSTTTWATDPSHSDAGFAVRHMMLSKVKGRFQTVSGGITFDENRIENSSINVEIETASITTYDAKRDEHLRSGDFFESETYPTITFESTKVIPGKGDTFQVIGDLTMHGATLPVAIDAEITGRTQSPWGNEVIGFEGRTKVNRKDFGLTWNVGLETGGVLVGDEVTITLEVEAIRQ